MSEKIYNHIAVDKLLGCMVLDTSLATNEKYPLDINDFQIQLHKIIFGTLHNLSGRGVKQATVADIEGFIKPYKAQYEVFIDSGGIEYIETITNNRITDVENFQYYYDSVRKMSLIRDMRDNGDGISEYWSDDKSTEENISKLEEFSCEDIIKSLEVKVIDRKRKYLIDKDDDTTRKKAGDNGVQILKSFKDSPLLGLNFESKYLSTLWGGWRKKQLFIRSGDTSSGKSRSAIGDLANICAREIYDIENKKWVENPNGGNCCLYIGCEMELDEEVDPLMWSYISGIESSRIIKGKYTEEEEKIISRAINVVNEDCMWLTDMPSFNIKKIEEEIAYYKKHCNISYVAFDYMLLSNALVKEFMQERGSHVGARGDEILLELSKCLKDISKKYDIGLLSATQVNADIKEFRNRDYQVLRGGKAIADKATGGSISMPITQQELKLVEPIIQKMKDRGKFKLGCEPNFVETVYKSRFSEYPKECKIFSNYNLGNMRHKELFVTDKDFKLIKVEIPEIIV